MCHFLIWNIEIQMDACRTLIFFPFSLCLFFWFGPIYFMAHPGPGNFSFCDLFCNFCDSPEFVDNILRIHKWQGDVNWTKMEKGKSSSSIFLFSFFIWINIIMTLQRSGLQKRLNKTLTNFNSMGFRKWF